MDYDTIHDDELGMALDAFVAGGWIDGDAELLKSGKEATAYRCRAMPATGQEYFIAKVYRDQRSRGFRNDVIYREWRYVAEARIRRAIANKSPEGREALFSTWIAGEYTTLRLLHGAGAAVPEPIARAGSAILMEYVGDTAGPAPHLRTVRLQPDEAPILCDHLLQEVERWLAANRIHTDLSPYNILYWRGHLVVIDFPQAVDPRDNPNAFFLL